jgi:hypothetical protein
LDPTAYCLTIVDFCGLGHGFPGGPPPTGLSSLEKVLHIERAVRDDICLAVPDHLRPDVRFIPYIQLHEYEGLLFSDPDAFAKAIHQPSLAHRFREIRGQFESPEDINDHPETAPSKRILAIYPSYRKVIDGTQAAGAIGTAAMRKECPHFRGWLQTLEALQQS